jgi:hypothetical protein
MGSLPANGVYMDLEYKLHYPKGKKTENNQFAKKQFVGMDNIENIEQILSCIPMCT